MYSYYFNYYLYKKTLKKQHKNYVFISVKCKNVNVSYIALK